MRCDYVVVGGGIMGVNTAYSLAKAGMSVMLLERGSLASGPPLSSSGDITRIFRSAYGGDRHMTRLSGLSLKLWHRFEAESQEDLFVASGMLVFGASDSASMRGWASSESAGWAAESFRTMRQAGLPCRLLRKPEIEERFPDIADHESYDHAVLDETAGYLYASRAVRAIGRLAVAAGVEVREHTVVEKLLGDGGNVRSVIANDEEIVLRRGVVLCAGAMNRSLAPELKPKTRVTRQQIVRFTVDPAVRQRLRRLPIVISLREKRYLYPIDEARLVVADDDARMPDNLVDPGQPLPELADEAFWQEAREFVNTYVPAMASLTESDGKSCLYTMTVRGGYLVYRRGNTVVVSACSGHGFKNGPIVGLIAAQLSTGDPGPWYTDAFRLENAEDFAS